LRKSLRLMSLFFLDICYSFRGDDRTVELERCVPLFIARSQSDLLNHPLFLWDL
jgi:hypothetical protein